MHPTTLNLILPVGISFYTFQALSYTIDVYRGKLNATRDIVSFFAFISFFPQLVAGPIERATNLLPQFQKKREFDYSIAVDGTRQILWGLFKKMIIADRCAIEVNAIFNDYQNASSLTLLLGALYFTFQIYGDFSGYSDIAIGVAKMFGISMKRNFNVPYFSKNIAEFWKRWHISLNSWFVDYVYIPLGGSREGKLKTIRNTFIIFLLSGLWHGANWTFIAWGLYHSILFIPLLMLGRSKVGVVNNSEKLVIRESLVNVIRIICTFFLVMLGWIVFRAETITDAISYIYRMFTNFSTTISNWSSTTIGFILIMLIVEWIGRYCDHPMKIFEVGLLSKYKLLRWSCYLLLIFAIITWSGKQATFIYFQF